MTSRACAIVAIGHVEDCDMCRAVIAAHESERGTATLFAHVQVCDVCRTLAHSHMAEKERSAMELENCYTQVFVKLVQKI